MWIVNGRMIKLSCIFLLAILFVSFTLTIPLERAESNLLGYIILVIMILLFTGSIILMPHYCEISDKGVTISYIFGLRETAEWKQIRKIYVVYDAMQRIFIRSQYVYQFIGLSGKKTFFMEGEFPKTKRLEKMIELYAKDKIISY